MKMNRDLLLAKQEEEIAVLKDVVKQLVTALRFTTNDLNNHTGGECREQIDFNLNLLRGVDL